MRRSLVLSLFAVACATTQPRPSEPAQPAPAVVATADIERLVSEGTQLHDKGDFDGAIARYRDALAADPGNPLASYELAFSLSAKGDHRAAIDAARIGLKRPWDGAPGLHMLIGTAHDELNEPEAAIASYLAGLEEYPGFPLLHFNLGVAYARQNANAKAIAAFKNSLALAPDHPGSHLQLAKVFLAEGYRVPAVFALARFLSLEPATQRSADASQLIAGVFSSAVRRKDAKTMQIVVGDSKTSEGDFAAVELGMSLVEATLTLPDRKDKRPDQVQRLESVLKLYAQMKQHGRGWSEQFYGGYYSALEQKGLVETFCYTALLGERSPEVASWVSANRARVTELLRFNEAYAWAR